LSQAIGVPCRALGFRGCGVSGGSGQEPAGSALGDTLRRPLKEGRCRGVSQWPSAGSVTGRGFLTGLPAQQKGPAIQAGPATRPDPSDHLACATVPEGATRRLFRAVRCGAVGRGASRRLGVWWRAASSLCWLFAHIVRSYPARLRDVARLRDIRTRRAGWVGAHDVREPSTFPGRTKPCTPAKRAFPSTKRNPRFWLSHKPPQSPNEPAGATLGAGSAGEVIGRIRPEGGQPWMAGPFCWAGSPVKKPRPVTDPAEGRR
jgi:hypothetical protein